MLLSPAFRRALEGDQMTRIATFNVNGVNGCMVA